MPQESAQRFGTPGAKSAFLVASFLIYLAGCGDGERVPQDIAKAKYESLTANIVGTLAGRRTWPSTGVKIWLSNPTVVVSCRKGVGSSTLLHAWGGNENDFNVPMARVNSGDTLFQLTQAEFVELSRSNEKILRHPR